MRRRGEIRGEGGKRGGVREERKRSKSGGKEKEESRKGKGQKGVVWDFCSKCVAVECVVYPIELSLFPSLPLCVCT